MALPDLPFQSQFYPWQIQPREQLARQYHQNKLPHALLLSRQADLGKRNFANGIARFLLCGAPELEQACGHCSGCALIAAGTHPDLKIVQPEEASKQIKIDQVRALIDWSFHTAQRNGLKIAIIDPADAMNVATANALLKSLEEPAGNTLMMLVTHQPAKLLATIRSRCQRVEFARQMPEAVLPWLAQQLPGNQHLAMLLNIAGGAPLAVVRQSDEQYLQRRQVVAQRLADLLVMQASAAETLAKLAVDDPVMVVNLLLELIADCLKLQFSKNNKDIKNIDIEREIHVICESVDSDFLFRLYERVLQEARHLASTSNVSPQLLLEGLFDAISHRQLKVF